MRWAVIEADGSIGNVIVWDGAEPAPIDPGQTLAEIPPDARVGIGWRWTEETGFEPT